MFHSGLWVCKLSGMASLTFDTLKFAERLIAAGVPDAHAKAEAAALSSCRQTGMTGHGSAKMPIAPIKRWHQPADGQHLKTSPGQPRRIFVWRTIIFTHLIN
jgi:hypothetical protein